MPTLYLSAPYDKSQFGSAFFKDFSTIVQNGIGPDYAIYSTLIGAIRPGMRVIVLIVCESGKPKERLVGWSLSRARGFRAMTYTSTA
jgi:hypothetical protein